MRHAAEQQSVTDFLLNVIPTTIVDAFAKGDILQVLLFSLLFGFALHAVGERARPVYDFIDRLSQVLFRIVGFIMRLAPIGAFGAMAFTIGKYGLGTLASLGALMACFYATCLVFIFVVLGLIARVHGFSIFRFVRYMRDELLIVLGTSSSESVLPRMMAKMENAGCRQAGRRPGDPDRLFVQPRRHVDLSDDGGRVHRAGDQYADDAARPADAAGRAAADIQGRGGRHGQRFHRSGRNAVRPWYIAGDRRSPHPWHRPVHVGGACADEPGRQRRRDAWSSRNGAEPWTSSDCSRSSGNNVADARVRAQWPRPTLMSDAIQFVPVTTPQQFDVVAGLAHEIWYEYYVPLIGRAQVDYMVSKFQSSGAMAGQMREGYEYYLAERDGRPHRVLRGAATAGGKQPVSEQAVSVTRRPRCGNRPGLHGVH